MDNIKFDNEKIKNLIEKKYGKTFNEEVYIIKRIDNLIKYYDYIKNKEEENLKKSKKR